MTRRRSPSHVSETALNNSILSLLARAPHLVCVWRNNTGVAMFEKRMVRFGTVGSSDILGVVTGTGRFLAIEGKSKRRKLTQDQHAFLTRINQSGGYGVVVRTVEAAWAAVNEARKAGSLAPPLEEPEKPRAKKAKAVARPAENKHFEVKFEACNATKERAQ